MNSTTLKDARQAAGLTQQQAATLLGVTQAYLSMLERGERPVSDAVAERAAMHLPVVPTALPFTGQRPEHFEDVLGALGYPGFAYLRSGKRMNPAELLLLALDTEDLPARVVEGLPWLPLAFPDLNWEWLLREAKVRNRQNRLGFILDLAREATARIPNPETVSLLTDKTRRLEASLLALEDSLCHASMGNAERKWLRTNRSPLATRWNVLSDLKLSHLDHVHV
jgi:transcriptional regulator with XRE-family HTH domain